MGRDLGYRGAQVQAISQKGVTASQPSRRRRLGTRRSLGQRFASAQEDLATGTELEYFALAAVRLARVATAAPVPDEPMTPVRPVLARHELDQIQLNFYGVVLFR